MPTPRTGSPVVARLRARIVPPLDTPESDAELIGRYVADRDEAAFAAVVRRHGRVVLGVCRRVLGNPADADDAFQATFLVLARKAHRVTFRADLSGWLFAVAVRAAREALRRRTRRAARETSGGLPDVPAAGPDAADADARRAVLDEVARLSDAYRAAVVLCDLEGYSRADAAARLGIPEGTLSSRLAAARKLLARRLAARGVTLAAAAGVAVPVPAALAARAVGVATAFVVPSITVAELAEAVMRTSPFGVKRILAAALASAVAVVGVAVGADEPAKPSAAARAEEPKLRFLVVTAETEGGMPRVPNSCRYQVQAVTADGTVVGTEDVKFAGASKLKKPVPFPSFPGVSPDGERVAYSYFPQFVNAEAKTGRPGFVPGEAATEPEAYIGSVDGTGPAVKTPVIFLPGRIAAWARDGSEVITVRETAPPFFWQDPVYTHERVAVATGRAVPLDLPKNCRVLDWSADGRTFVAAETVRSLLGDTHRLVVVTPRPGGKPAVKAVAPATRAPVALAAAAAAHPAIAAALSPDGRRVAFVHGPDLAQPAIPFGLPAMGFTWGAVTAGNPLGFVADLETGRVSVLPPAEGPDRSPLQALTVAWSPDGNRLAFSCLAPLFAYKPRPETQGTCVVVCDPDGRNARAFRPFPSAPNTLTVGYLAGWR